MDASSPFADLVIGMDGHPDAVLIEACDLLRAHWDEAKRRGRAGAAFRAWLSETAGERDALEELVTRTEAQTALGRRVKAETALHYVDHWPGGSCHDLPRAALEELLRAAE